MSETRPPGLAAAMPAARALRVASSSFAVSASILPTAIVRAASPK